MPRSGVTETLSDAELVRVVHVFIKNRQGKMQVANMERLIYWIKKCIHHNNKFCKHVCVTCEFYDFCRRDGELD